MALLTRKMVTDALEANKGSLGNEPKSQSELADKAGISRVGLSRWLSGARNDIKLNTANLIAEALGI